MIESKPYFAMSDAYNFFTAFEKENDTINISEAIRRLGLSFSWGHKLATFLMEEGYLRGEKLGREHIIKLSAKGKTVRSGVMLLKNHTGGNQNE